MRRSALPAVLLLCAAVRLGGQEPCDSLVARAFNEFDANRRLQLLVPALDPSACPPRGSWVVGVQLLGQTLIDAGQDSLAAVWLRWAIRLAPDMKIDTLRFTPRLAAAHEAAREFLRRNATGGDSLAATTWLWPVRVGEERLGHLQVSRTSLPDSGRAAVEGIGPITPGENSPLSPGTYAIRVSAAGYDSLRVTREVLPGVTTVVELHLRPGPAAIEAVRQPQAPAAPPPAQPVSPPQAPGVAPSARRGFPWKWAALGAAVVGTLAAIVFKGGGGEETGGIIITFPP